MSSTFLGNEKEETKPFLKPEYFKNRELSWMDFNDRVLEEARNKDNPLLERINFLGITQSNVDEFFMVRVASLHKLIAAGIKTTEPQIPITPIFSRSTNGTIINCGTEAFSK